MKTIPWMASGVSEGKQPIWHEPASTGEVRRLASFDELYRDEYGPMVRLARGLVDTQEIAEEITQDAFARVYERWSRLDNPGGYLRTAVVNGARSELRKARSETAHRHSTVHSPPTRGSGLPARCPRPALTPPEDRPCLEVLRRHDRKRDRPGHGGKARHSKERHLPRIGRVAKGGRAVNDERRTPDNQTGADDQALGEALGSAIRGRVDTPAAPPPVSSIAERAAARAKARNTRRAVVGIAASAALVVGGISAWNALEGDQPNEVIVVDNPTASPAPQPSAEPTSAPTSASSK